MAGMIALPPLVVRLRKFSDELFVLRDQRRQPCPLVLRNLLESLLFLVLRFAPLLEHCVTERRELRIGVNRAEVDGFGNPCGDVAVTPSPRRCRPCREAGRPDTQRRIDDMNAELCPVASRCPKLADGRARAESVRQLDLDRTVRIG